MVIEAISRGAGMVYFVESSADAVELIRKNLASLKIAGGFNVLKQDVSRAVRSLQTPVDFVLLDPPYRLSEEYEKTLSALSKSSLLRENSVVIVETHKKVEPSEEFGRLRRYRKLEQGDAVLHFYRLS